jgi:outer membrane protein assembly factor BamA
MLCRKNPAKNITTARPSAFGVVVACQASAPSATFIRNRKVNRRFSVSGAAWSAAFDTTAPVNVGNAYDATAPRGTPTSVVSPASVTITMGTSALLPSPLGRWPTARPSHAAKNPASQRKNRMHKGEASSVYRATGCRRSGTRTSTGGGGRTARVLARAALVLLSLWAAACSPARREVQSDIVRRIRFEGNGGWFSDQNDLQLRAPMEQRQSPPLTFTFPFMYFTQPVPYDASTLQSDSKRLAVWYAHHGWFDARFLGWEIRRVRERGRGKAGVVDIFGHVDSGEPSIVRKMELVDARRASAERTAWTASLGRAPIQPGDTFNLDYARETQRLLLETLRDSGYAYASVDLQMDAYPDEHTVDLSFRASSGILAYFGEVTIEGDTTVSHDLILDSLSFTPFQPGAERRDGVDRPGGQFGERELRETQQRLYETGLFSMVNIAPDLSDPTREQVPIRIEVRDAKPRRLRIGGGVEFDYFLLRPQLTAEYRDVRVGGSGLQLDARATAGAVIGVVNQAAGENPAFGIASGRIRFDYPWLLNRKLGISASAYAVNDLQFGALPYWTLGADLGFRYSFSKKLYANFGPHFEYFQYYALSNATQEAAQLQFGTGWTSENYRLLSVDAGLRLDDRDNVLSPRSGSYWALDLRQSIPIPNFQGQGFDGSFLYTRIDAEVRGWKPFRIGGDTRRLPFVFAGRAHGRVLIPWRGMEDVLPYPDKGFLGGPNSLRGFRTNQVGPYNLACAYDNGRPTPMHNNGASYQVDRTYLPNGGGLALEGSTELRYQWKYGLSFAVFGDVGLLADRADDLTRPAAEVAQQMLRYSAGVGLRYDTPIGPVRIDLGLRPIFLEDTSGPQVTPSSCNAIDVRPRNYDLISASRPDPLWSAATAKAPPLAINLFLAIGEAF